jgi:hypothetical protein
MADSYWSGLGVAAGTAISTGNVNANNNSDASTHSHSVTYSVSGSPTATFEQPADPAGPGLSITGAATTISRLDLTQVTADGGACQVLYTPSGTPTTSDSVIAIARNASANMGSAHHVVATNTIAFRDTAGTTSVTNGTSPTLTTGHTYQVDLIVDLNASPTTSNGRLIGRVLDLSDSTWNGNGEFFVDTDYTINIGVAQNTQWRVGKVTSAAVQPQTYYTGIRWGERTALDTSNDPAVAKTQFIQVVTPYNPPTDIPANVLIDPASVGHPIVAIAPSGRWLSYVSHGWSLCCYYCHYR